MPDQPIQRWQDHIQTLHQTQCDHVLVTVLNTTGSAPRAAGSKMIVTHDACIDTIGGGQLEWLVMEHARTQLQAGRSATEVHHLPLAAAALQCCGGSVTVLFETVIFSQQHVFLFGMGHVGQAVARLLRGTQTPLTCIDSRSGLDQVDEVVAQPGPWIATQEIPLALVMTHDHQQDYEVVSALLSSNTTWIGLIGSATKWERFKARLQNDGFDAQALARVCCPVGIPDIQDKQPNAVAISIAAQVLQLTTGTQAPVSSNWKQIRNTLILESGV